MSAAQPPVPLPPRPAPRNEVTIVGHSTLFYWWPVWAVGFLMAFLTWLDSTRMVTVPKDSLIAEAPKVTIKERPKSNNEPTEVISKNRIIVLLPEDNEKHKDLRERLYTNYPELKEGPVNPKLWMSYRRGYGVIFAVTLLLVVIITNVPLRGMWSILVIVGTVTLVLIFNLAGIWGDIVRSVSLLDIRINLGGYFFISTVLLIAWAVTVFLFDKQIYLTFTPGQLKVCTEIGGGEKVYDAVGMSVEKQQGDMFRHRILGLGSGDLVVKTSGAQAHHFELYNVLWISRKVRLIEEMLQTKKVTE
jgi:hypothetical protein